MQSFKSFMEQQDKVSYSQEVDNFCWSHLLINPKELVRRFENHEDHFVEEGEGFYIYQYKNSSYYYKVVNTIDGVKIDSVWNNED